MRLSTMWEGRTDGLRLPGRENGSAVPLSVKLRKDAPPKHRLDLLRGALSLGVVRDVPPFVLPWVV